jgi:cobalt-zinc-cadmium efflux system membrane fusion protein
MAVGAIVTEAAPQSTPPPGPDGAAATLENRMNLKTKSAIGGVLLAAGIGIAWTLADHGRATPPAAPAAVSDATPAGPDNLNYRAGAAQLNMLRAQVLPALPLPVGDVLNARVAYDEDVTARIGAGVAGRIVAIRVAPGDRVRAGQALAELDSADAGTALADVAKARADEERKRAALERAKDLVPGEAIASKEWEATQADYAQARAETLRAEQRVNNLNPQGMRARGQRISLTSPLSGVVTERSATPALEVTAGMAAPLFVVTDPTRLWLMIDVPEQLLGAVRLGAAIDVEGDAFPGQHFKATVAQLGQVVDPNTRRVVVRARLANPGLKLLPEMFVRCAVLTERGTAVRVPNSALVNRGLYTYVFVQTAPGQFRRRQVSVKTHGGDFSYVGDGVSGGEAIVTTGALLLDAEMSTRAGGQP